ncbi:bifunctional pantoate--beta-alanine ligase/(d)CMP kinase [Prochlorococcus sp. MIT 1300]|uniref:bifunctional pantoate--beta-alanine ligase/(d)CMP kinase n=1 Tax=Prochlorococcus sp. MIT 1300 TaxID=3096218 RepID=UPI002A75CB7A|nr:bifunctional pantoate--beta-alanine ligase/(d)CMP kinase [Prochlorococcus sp. MIT 1300]
MGYPILKTQEELRLWQKQQGSPINFVPTMGGLHKGHASLIATAKALTQKRPGNVLVSIFVNPLQFGPNEDFERYPRDLANDYELAVSSGASAIWAPTVKEIFSEDPESYIIKADEELQKELCGRTRPGHFDGVVTIINRLLMLIKPKTLILGEKDWQQLMIIKSLIKRLSLSVRVISVSTVRDQDGLAFSSRNRQLTTFQRSQARKLPKLLKKASDLYQKTKEINLIDINFMLQESGLEVEYLQTVDPYLLKPTNPSGELSLLAAAVRCGETRLIDHAFLMTRKPIIAIDGPAGAGKSTVTRALAKKLGLLYIDTGAMYRAVTWLMFNKQVNIDNEQEVDKLLSKLDLELDNSDSSLTRVRVNNQDVTEIIRSQKVTALVSKIASLESVRNALTNQQKQMGNSGGLIAEGRDIGTAVFPKAELKIFLTASSKERAKRRAFDLKQKGFKVPSLSQLEAQIKERDHLDSSREIAPLIKAKDAIEIITDGKNIDEVVEDITDLFHQRIPEEVWPIRKN